MSEGELVAGIGRHGDTALAVLCAQVGDAAALVPGVRPQPGARRLDG